MKKITSTYPNRIEPPAIKEALKLLKEIQKTTPTEDEVNAMVATVANLIGWQTNVTTMLPKGTVLIGMGKDKMDEFMHQPIKMECGNKEGGALSIGTA
jgi:hypothetical protein